MFAVRKRCDCYAQPHAYYRTKLLGSISANDNTKTAKPNTAIVLSFLQYTFIKKKIPIVQMRCFLGFF